MPILLILLQIIAVLQMLFSYGTAYRLTKYGGDSGVSLFFWMLILGLASTIPGLGFYLWFRNRESYQGQAGSAVYINKADDNIKPL
ncbi:MAG: hypothetical protein FWD16_06910, partial [Clostridia bacterium]|nr:hypothetical protein [Clostridia bacterium]